LDRNTARGLASTKERVYGFSLYFLLTPRQLLF